MKYQGGLVRKVKKSPICKEFAFRFLEEIPKNGTISEGIAYIIDVIET